MFCLFHNNSVTSFPVCSSKKRGSLPPKPEPPPPDALSVASLEALEETSIDTLESSDQKIDIRNRLHNLAFIFSLPHLVMLSNLQKLIGKCCHFWRLNVLIFDQWHYVFQAFVQAKNHQSTPMTTWITCFKMPRIP